MQRDDDVWLQRKQTRFDVNHPQERLELSWIENEISENPSRVKNNFSQETLKSRRAIQSLSDERRTRD